MDSTRVRVNIPDVMHETIDGETIIINLASGNYYSARGVAGDVWAAIAHASSASVAELAALLASRYADGADDLPGTVSTFVEELRQEGLVAETSEVGDQPPTLNGANGSAAQFAAPRLEKYDDLQDLVLLDPVHQVDQAGWPAPAPSSTS